VTADRAAAGNAAPVVILTHVDINLKLVNAGVAQGERLADSGRQENILVGNLPSSRSPFVKKATFVSTFWPRPGEQTT
jgi:hypothetical protein